MSQSSSLLLSQILAATSTIGKGEYTTLLLGNSYLFISCSKSMGSMYLAPSTVKMTPSVWKTLGSNVFCTVSTDALAPGLPFIASSFISKSFSSSTSTSISTGDDGGACVSLAISNHELMQSHQRLGLLYALVVAIHPLLDVSGYPIAADRDLSEHVVLRQILSMICCCLEVTVHLIETPSLLPSASPSPPLLLYQSLSDCHVGTVMLNWLSYCEKHTMVYVSVCNGSISNSRSRSR